MNQDRETHQLTNGLPQGALWTSLIVLAGLQLFVLAWMLIDRTRSEGAGDDELHAIVLLIACVNTLVVSRSWFLKRIQPLRLGFVAAAGLILVLSLTSLVVVDYGAVARSGPVPVTVMAVALVLAFFRTRTTQQPK